MVAHVAQRPAQFEVGVGGPFPEELAQLVEQVAQRLDRPLELDDLADELVDAARGSRVAVEHLGLDLVDVVLQADEHERVVVDDLVCDGVEHGVGSVVEQRRVLFQALAHRGEVGLVGVAHGDDEVAADEQVHLADLDDLGAVDVAGGSRHDEQLIAVALQLGPLVGGGGRPTPPLPP